MGFHHDILDERDPIRKHLACSLALHAALFGSIVASRWLGAGAREPWGDPNSPGGGPTVGVTAVNRLPIAARGGPQNPVANDTDSLVPAAPKPETRPNAPEPAPDAIALKSHSRETARQPVKESRQRYRTPEMDRPNQLYSTTGAAAASRIYGGASSSGGLDVGSGSPFGGRFGYYEQLLRQRVAAMWRTQELDPRRQLGPAAIITFEILSNGSIRNLRLAQRSGYTELDYSAQRAVTEAAPFPPLPAGFDRDSAVIEFWFQLKR